MQKHSLWRNIIILPKTTILSVFELVTYKNGKQKCMKSTLFGETKRHYEKKYITSVLSILIWGKETGLTETCHLSVYERSRHQNDKGKESNKNALQCF